MKVRFGWVSVGQGTRFRKSARALEIRGRENAPRIWRSCDNAKREETEAGPIVRANEPAIDDIPLSFPRACRFGFFSEVENTVSDTITERGDKFTEAALTRIIHYSFCVKMSNRTTQLKAPLITHERIRQVENDRYPEYTTHGHPSPTSNFPLSTRLPHCNAIA